MKTAVHFYLEDGFLVRGTSDPVTALGLAVAEDDEFEARYAAADAAHRNATEHEQDGPPTAEEIDDLATLLYGLIERARPGLYRIRPANRAERDYGDGYAWWTMYAKRRGPGAFEGVEFLL